MALGLLVLRRRTRLVGAAHIAALNEAQTEALDRLNGQLEPGPDGRPEVFDVMGVNYCRFNQRVHEGERVNASGPRYRRLYRLLQEAHGRYDWPIFLSGVGIEGDQRTEWLREVRRAVRDAVQAGVPLEGICLYPASYGPSRLRQ
jgi:hypothetical protein